MKCEVLQKLGMKPGYFKVATMEALENARIRNTKKSISDFERKNYETGIY